MNPGSGIPNRYELNRRVSTVLTCHSIDLQQVTVSCSTSIVYISGSLKKTPGADPLITPAHIEALLKDIIRIPHIRGVSWDLDNWSIFSTDGAWQILPVKQQRRPSQQSQQYTPEDEE